MISQQDLTVQTRKENIEKKKNKLRNEYAMNRHPSNTFEKIKKKIKKENRKKSKQERKRYNE